ncbi:D-isomer specific 2-hydroxyacid dehydrogenase NAD-binding protein [Alicycliphilus sp. B1]|nr:D-isomer specific 2-hydroxyacid dehydrogenase NAD-binding protein [Alicycliphilus sp. B1]
MTQRPPRILQYGRMPLPALDRELAERYDVAVLSEQADPARFLAGHGATFDCVVTSAAMGLPAHVVDALPHLRYVSSFGVGFDALDRQALLRRGARVGYTPGVLDDCVADMAFALLLDAARGLSTADRFVRRGGWSRQRFGIHTRAPAESAWASSAWAASAAPWRGARPASTCRWPTTTGARSRARPTGTCPRCWSWRAGRTSWSSPPPAARARATW